MAGCCLSRIAPILLISVALTAFALPSDSLPPILANQNHTAAGELRDGVLTLHLEIAKGSWHPEADDGMALAVYAFGETGRPLQNPGPLVRVPQGTEIHATLHNALDVPVTVHGLSDPALPAEAGVPIAPGATQHVNFKATTPGLFFYWGASEQQDLKLRHGVDSELTGAFAVDPPGASADDEIFVIEMISEFAGIRSRKTLATINGKSWPFTQRFQYELGHIAHWRWINATNEPHAMHLHGFYFRVDAFNRAGHVQTYARDARPLAVTQRIAQGETFDMSWSPDRSGQWLFHCHMTQHMVPAIVPELPGLSVQPAPVHSVAHASLHDVAGGMGQLVLGVTVPQAKTPPPNITWHANHKLQLVLNERPGIPRYAIEVHDGAQPSPVPTKPALLGPPIILTRDQPSEIEIVNRLTQPTAIHWHGIELESFYDGVPGWSGTASQTTPPIVPGTSFVAHIVPPRAGTFIYHTHWHDESQLTNGLYGPLLVLPPGEKFDPKSDLTFVFSIGDFDALQELALINGTPQSKTLHLQAGKKYRFRLINISTNNQGMQVSLRGSSGPVEWKVTAKDGADLPIAAVHPGPAQLTITVGETYDVEFLSENPQELLLDLLLPAQKIHTSQTLLFTPAMEAANNP